MKTISATFLFQDGARATGTARFASVPGESAIEWSGDTTRLAAEFGGKLVVQAYAETFATAMRTLGGYAHARVEIEESGDWEVLDQ